MTVTKFYGGFNPVWKAGQYERKIVELIADELALKYPNMNCVVAVPSWHEPADLVNDICNVNPDITVICSLSDPLGPIENMLKSIPGRIILLGYVAEGIQFDFWAFACRYFFRQYAFEEVSPGDLEHIYLNYNRKPHQHRVSLINRFEEHDLIKYGITTLGNSKYSLNDKHDDFVEYGANDVVGDVGIPNDIYSLGNLDIWNKCFLNIVSETQFEYSPNAFVSEKIYKPIIGLRPFVINGSPSIYAWLKNMGFDCFDDLFPVNELSDNNCVPGARFKNHSAIIDSVKDLIGQDLNKLYASLLPRLLNNQKIFYEYTKNQPDHFM